MFLISHGLSAKSYREVGPGGGGLVDRDVDSNPIDPRSILLGKENANKCLRGLGWPLKKV